MKKQITIRQTGKVPTAQVAAFELMARKIFDSEVKPSIERAKNTSMPLNVVPCNNPV